jgi:hypothetical protein
MNVAMRLASIALFGVLLGSACREVRSEPTPELALVPAGWTNTFQREAVLVADEIEIEGPSDLIQHVVLRDDPENAVYTTKTVSEGLRQELVARPETRMEVRGQLDAWSLAAFRRITVLQRPGEVPVTVRARGNVYWAAAGGGERRADVLDFRGVRGE